MSEHGSLPRGSETAHPPGYIQNTDPGAVGAFKPWWKTDDDTTPTAVIGVFIRNAANSGWIDALAAVAGAISSVFGRTGAVVAAEGDYSLTQLLDVILATEGAGDFLRHNGVNWVNDTIQDGDLGSGTPDGTKFLRDDRTWAATPTGATDLDGLSDVVITAPADGNFIVRRAGTFVNDSVLASDVPSLDASKIGSGTFADARIAASNVTQHQASLSGLAGTQMTNNVRDVAVPFIIDGGGSAITTGLKGGFEVPFSGTIVAARVFALDGNTGSIVIDLWKDTYANFPPTVADTITASAKPTISSAVKAEDTTLTGWTTAVTAGDIVFVNVDSIATFTRVLLSLTIRRS